MLPPSPDVSPVLQRSATGSGSACRLHRQQVLTLLAWELDPTIPGNSLYPLGRAWAYGDYKRHDVGTLGGAAVAPADIAYSRNYSMEERTNHELHHPLRPFLDASCGRHCHPVDCARAVPGWLWSLGESAIPNSVRIRGRRTGLDRGTFVPRGPCPVDDDSTAGDEDGTSCPQNP